MNLKCGGKRMFISYNYFRQWNNNKKIENHKDFYKKFSNEREFGGTHTHMDHLVQNRFSNTLQHIYNAILRSHPKKILDIGCGDGVNLPLANIFPEIEYEGIDYAEQTIEAAKRNYPNIHFKVGDAFDLPYKDDSFDMAIISSVLILYKDETDRVKLLKEANRILKDNGILIINVWNDTFMIRNSIRLSRFLGKLNHDCLPQDFMGCHFSFNDVYNMVSKTGRYKIVERIQTAQLMGVLECARYINRSKYHRKFGKEQLETKKLPQNVKTDLLIQAGGNNKITSFLYGLMKINPNWFSWANIYILRVVKN